LVTVSNGSGWRSATSATLWLTGDPFAWYADVAWDGHNFVAVGSAMAIAASQDGVTWWRQLPSVSQVNLTAVAGSGSDWVAVGTGGSLLHASAADPKTWTAVASPTSTDLLAATWTGSQFVAVGKAGTVLTSQSGTAWTLKPAAGSDDLESVAAASPTSIVAMSRGVTGTPTTLLRSADATNWTPSYTPTLLLNRVTYVNGRYLAVGDYISATSTDGSTWSTSTNVGGILNASTYDGTRFIAIGIDMSAEQTVFGSTDGLSWTPMVSDMNLSYIARSPVDGRLVSSNTGHSSYIQTSLDGIAWQYTNLPNPNAFLDVVWAPTLGGFAALVQSNPNPYFYQSPDGTTWTQVGSAPCYGNIAASASTIVNLGFSSSGPCIATTVSGTAWTFRTAPGTYAKVVWTGSQFLALGSGGALASAAADGATWTGRCQAALRRRCRGPRTRVRSSWSSVTLAPCSAARITAKPG
jgi:hypothetical protein